MEGVTEKLHLLYFDMEQNDKLLETDPKKIELIEQTDIMKNEIKELKAKFRDM